MVKQAVDSSLVGQPTKKMLAILMVTMMTVMVMKLFLVTEKHYKSRIGMFKSQDRGKILNRNHVILLLRKSMVDLAIKHNIITTRVFIFFIRHFSNCSILHRNALSARAACLDWRLKIVNKSRLSFYVSLLAYFSHSDF